MVKFDSCDFRQHLLAACLKSFTEVQRLCNGEGLYGFSLMLDRFGSAIAAMGQSEARLEESVSKELDCWTSTTANVADLVRKTKKWTCEDWLSIEQSFDAVNSLLNTSYVSDPHEYVGGGTSRLVFLSCLEVLAELDVREVFGKDRSRESIVLNLNVGDQSDEELLRWAVQINPYDVYARFSAELQESHLAFKELTYIGSS